MLVQGSLVSLLALCTHELIYYLTALDEEDCRDVTDAEASWQIAIGVYIALTYDGSAFVFLSQLFDDRAYHHARAAPGSPKVYYDQLALGGEGLKVLVCDCQCHC